MGLRGEERKLRLFVVDRKRLFKVPWYGTRHVLHLRSRYRLSYRVTESVTDSHRSILVSYTVAGTGLSQKRPRVIWVTVPEVYVVRSRSFETFFGRDISILHKDMSLHCFISVFIPSSQAKFQVSRLKG